MWCQKQFVLGLIWVALTVRADNMVAICFASLEAAKTVEAATGVATGRVSGSGLGTMAMEELVLSLSSSEAWTDLFPTLPLLLLEFLCPFHRRGLVPLGWRRPWWLFLPCSGLIVAFNATSCVTIHDSSKAVVTSSSPVRSPINSIVCTKINRMNIAQQIYCYKPIYLECPQEPSRLLHSFYIRPQRRALPSSLHQWLQKDSFSIGSTWLNSSYISQIRQKNFQGLPGKNNCWTKTTNT